MKTRECVAFFFLLFQLCPRFSLLQKKKQGCRNDPFFSFDGSFFLEG